jgi:hypothetical protein
MFTSSVAMCPKFSFRVKEFVKVCGFCFTDAQNGNEGFLERSSLQAKVELNPYLTVRRICDEEQPAQQLWPDYRLMVIVEVSAALR